MQNELRKDHIKAFMKLEAHERLIWSLSTAWTTFNALSEDKQKVYLKMRKNEERQR